MEGDKIKFTLELAERDLVELFGAIRLGVWLEDWCATLSQSASGNCDTSSYKWCMRVLSTLEKMKEKSGISYEWKEYAQDKWAISLIDDFVDTKGLEFIRNIDKEKAGLDIQNKMLNNDKDE